ncbi:MULTISPECIES: exopolysaccharide biosynthesis protein [Modicisalibacter]|uniref:exopolysaccharide biosynthesis protein n=1 Tax=Modicisalibacter TaxID=574347 RepID=UPI001CCA24CC|nr:MULTISPECIES: exopolysaccharide biosynthesis protein [Halomonadaceae]
MNGLEALLTRLLASAEGEGDVTLERMLAALGERAFGPVMLFAGLVTVMPLLGDIPGVPTLMALLVALTAGQLLLQRRRFWLPRWLLRRSMASRHVRSGVRRLLPLARLIDRGLRPRWCVLTGEVGSHLIAVACLAIAAAMPVMEFIPFSATGAGIALVAFGLALVARDGVLALLALACTGVTAGLVGHWLW